MSKDNKKIPSQNILLAKSIINTSHVIWNKKESQKELSDSFVHRKLLTENLKGHISVKCFTISARQIPLRAALFQFISVSKKHSWSLDILSRGGARDSESVGSGFESHQRPDYLMTFTLPHAACILTRNPGSCHRAW